MKSEEGICGWGVNIMNVRNLNINPMNIYMADIAIPQPIFTKLEVLASRLNSVGCAEIHPIWAYIAHVVHKKKMKWDDLSRCVYDYMEIIQRNYGP